MEDNTFALGYIQIIFMDVYASLYNLGNFDKMERSEELTVYRKTDLSTL